MITIETILMVIILTILIGLIIDNLDPDLLDINFFSVNELLNGGSNYVYYFGFDTEIKKYFWNTNFDGLFWS